VNNTCGSQTIKARAGQFIAQHRWNTLAKARAVPNPLQETTFGFVLSRQGHEKGKCNDPTKRYNDINKKTMANRCRFSHQKQGKKRGYLKNQMQKTYQMLLEFRGSNQTRRIKCRSRENYQSRDHVGQTRNWNSVFQSAGCNPIATNRSSIKTKINRNKKAGTEKDWRQNSSTGVLRAKIKQWSTDQIK
jgi:hypothetical protein